MLSPVKNIAFGGIYDFVVPSGTPKEKIDVKVAQTQKFIRENLSADFYMVIGFDDRIRLVSVADNPNIMLALFDTIGGKDLAKQYINRNKQEYRLNLQV